MRTYAIHKQRPLMTMAQEPAHTQEWWRLKRGTFFDELGEIKDYYWVGFGRIGDETPIWSKTLKENEANMRLAASAPEMLQALQAVADNMADNDSLLARQVREAIKTATQER
jgi:hypothetical protein